MAIIWRKKVKDDIYEVRSAGNSRRLYSNGVFHSHYNPNHALSNSIWDLLMLPALFQPKGSVKRVLLMGVGGGTAVKLLNHYVKPEEIIGVEINPVHLTVARKYFKVNRQEAQLICADAIEWLKNYKGPAFDMIIDDMFGHAGGEINRAVQLNANWFSILNRNLNGNGLLIINTTDAATLRQCAYFTNKKINSMFKNLYRFAHPTCENFIGAFFKTNRTKKELLTNIQCEQDIKSRNALIGMDYTLKKLD